MVGIMDCHGRDHGLPWWGLGTAMVGSRTAVVGITDCHGRDYRLPWWGLQPKAQYPPEEQDILREAQIRIIKDEYRRKNEVLPVPPPLFRYLPPLAGLW